MKAIDWTHIYGSKKYRGKWVAVRSIADTEVIASSKTLKDTLRKAEKKGVKHPMVAQIPKKILPIVGVT